MVVDMYRQGPHQVVKQSMKMYLFSAFAFACTAAQLRPCSKWTPLSSCARSRKGMSRSSTAGVRNKRVAVARGNVDSFFIEQSFGMSHKDSSITRILRQDRGRARIAGRGKAAFAALPETKSPAGVAGRSTGIGYAE